ncbi:hypothetical protein [Geothrix sp.]|jgi:hypothetical protein|uniref:hypothetical protein n=1 Tax=Geothrix sp. TaxID=1962974 RepID=UPI0025BD7823|nr:hypothetical protein [Geothrix sp.]
MSDNLIFVAFIASALTIAWAIALLVAVWKVRDALVDEDYPVVDLEGGGVSYRVKVSRIRGRFGATYQRKDGEPVTVEPRFKDRGAVMIYIRKAVTSA